MPNTRFFFFVYLFGVFSVCLSGDGNVLAIGVISSNFDSLSNGLNIGRVRAYYVREACGWYMWTEIDGFSIWPGFGASVDLKKWLCTIYMSSNLLRNYRPGTVRPGYQRLWTSNPGPRRRLVHTVSDFSGERGRIWWLYPKRHFSIRKKTTKVTLLTNCSSVLLPVRTFNFEVYCTINTQPIPPFPLTTDPGFFFFVFFPFYQVVIWDDSFDRSSSNPNSQHSLEKNETGYELSLRLRFRSSL